MDCMCDFYYFPTQKESVNNVMDDRERVFLSSFCQSEYES